MRRTAARAVVLLLLCVLSAAGCAGPAPEPAGAATVAGVAEVPPAGLLEAEELPPDTFAFEIMPEADDHIAEMQIAYYGGADGRFLGQLVLEPETDRYFTRGDTFRRGFTVSDPDLLRNFTLSFILVDENGTETQAKNDYTVDADYGVFYFVKVTGSRDGGYELSDR